MTTHATYEELVQRLAQAERDRDEWQGVAQVRKTFEMERYRRAEEKADKLAEALREALVAYEEANAR